MSNLKERIRHTRDRLAIPTDIQLADRFLQRDIKHVISVPCSITATVDPYWKKRADEGEMEYWKVVNEHSLVGVGSGVYFGTGKLALLHFQNSGIGNALDGFVSYAGVYKIPTLAIATWRGNDEKDDSEPHQEIGRRTNQLTKDVVDRDSIFGEKSGRGILRQIDQAIDSAKEDNQVILRLSPGAFKKTYQLALPKIEENSPGKIQGRREELRQQKGEAADVVFRREVVSREEAIKEIVVGHRSAAIIFSNGFTAREAQSKADRVGNFYNAGYMGGGTAIGWGMAMANPDIEVIVVDGDQNALMGKMQEVMAAEYPKNLHWYILDNGFGTSVGVSESRPLPFWYYDLAHIIRTIPDKPNEFSSPRVGSRGVYFALDEAKEMSDRIGPLPTHAQRFRQWVEATTKENIALGTNSSIRVVRQFGS